MNEVEKKEINDYFRTNIFESYTAYVGWKVIKGSKSIGIVSEEMANRYVEIQNYHNNFFGITELAFLIQFVLLSLHGFDKDDRSFSLYKVDEQETKKFIVDNKVVLDMLFSLRNKIFAHRDAGSNQYQIPSIKNLDSFFKNLIEFYNKLTLKIDDSKTIFLNAEEIKFDIEHLFMNLYRGELARKKEIEIKWLWENNEGKISSVI